jgi:hypothetical protein
MVQGPICWSQAALSAVYLQVGFAPAAAGGGMWVGGPRAVAVSVAALLGGVAGGAWLQQHPSWDAQLTAACPMALVALAAVALPRSGLVPP